MNKKLFLSLYLMGTIPGVVRGESIVKGPDSIIKLIQEMVKCDSSINEIKKININKEEHFKIAGALVEFNSENKISICSPEGCFFQDTKKEKGPYKIKIKDQETFFKLDEANRLTAVDIKQIAKNEDSIFKEIPLTKLADIKKDSKFINKINKKLAKELKQLPHFKNNKSKIFKKLSQNDKGKFLEEENKLKINCSQVLMKLDLQVDNKGNMINKKHDKSDDARVVKDKSGSIQDATKPLDDSYSR